MSLFDMFPYRVRGELKALWVVVLAYGPVALFLAVRFDWPLGDLNENLGGYIADSALIIGALLFVVGLINLFKSFRWAVLLFAICLLDYLILYSPLRDDLDLASFESYIRSEPVYAKKHCAPINFNQDGRTYSLGFCHLVMAKDGTVDFDLVYDTSGDVGRYDQLTRTDKIIFANAVRRYFDDDPNEAFEYADFTGYHYDLDFYGVWFDDANAEGFTAAFGEPPADPRNRYKPIFW